MKVYQIIKHEAESDDLYRIWRVNSLIEWVKWVGDLN